MTKKTIVRIFAGCLLALAPSLPAAAAGDGIQLGPALVFPTLSVTETHDDNIGLASGGTESDWVTSVAPAVRVALPIRRFFLQAEGGLDFLSYRENDGENSNDWFVGATGGADFPGGLSFRIGDTHSQRRLLGSQEFGAGEDLSVNTLRGTVGYVLRDALRLELSGTRTDYAYDRSESRQRTESALQAGLSWKFRPRLAATFDVGVADYAYDSNEAQDGSATQAALGVSWEVTAKSTGFAKAGYQWKRYDEENPARGIEDADFYTLSAGLRHSFTSRTTAQLDLARAAQESDFPENPYFLRTSVGASVGQRFTAKIYGRAGLRYARDEYPEETTYTNPFDPEAITQTDKRSDSILNANLTLGFDVTRWLALELSYGGEKRTSNFDTFEYNATRVSLSAKAAF